MIAICTKEPELLLHHGSLRQTGHKQLSLSFPQDTSYGHPFWGEERLAAELGLEISHWAHSAGLGWLWWKSCSRTGNSTNTTEISPHPPVLYFVLFTLSFPFLQSAPGYSLVICSGGNVTLGWDGDKKLTKIPFVLKHVEVSWKLNDHGLLKVMSAQVIICSAGRFLALVFCTSWAEGIEQCWALEVSLDMSTAATHAALTPGTVSGTGL